MSGRQGQWSANMALSVSVSSEFFSAKDRSTPIAQTLVQEYKTQLFVNRKAELSRHLCIVQWTNEAALIAILDLRGCFSIRPSDFKSLASMNRPVWEA